MYFSKTQLKNAHLWIPKYFLETAELLYLKIFKEQQKEN